MRFTSSLEQFILLFVRNHTIMATMVASVLLALSVALISPLIYPVPIPYIDSAVIIYAPISFLPGGEYEILARGLATDVGFDITEGNSAVTITGVTDFSDNLTKKNYKIRVSASPQFWMFETANLTVEYEMVSSGGIYTTAIPVDKLSLPLRLLMTFLISTPGLVILNYLREKFSRK